MLIVQCLDIEINSKIQKQEKHVYKLYVFLGDSTQYI